jgi:SAM-dependent methyltransferase/putative flippase GtrA
MSRVAKVGESATAPTNSGCAVPVDVEAAKAEAGTGRSFKTILLAELKVAAGQLGRYAGVGVTTNAAAYLLYLLLTRVGLAPMVAATIAFAAAVAASFVLNRNLTFRSRGDRRTSLRRYVIAYGTAYVADIAGLYVFVNLFGYPHEIVQLVLIVVTACGLFLTQKFWVFAVAGDGMRCGTPEVALGSEDYPTEVYDRLCSLEEKHFWFRARNRIILREFRRRLGHLLRPRILEIGCGTGYVLRGLASEGSYELTGIEPNLAGLRHARARAPSVEFVQLDARELPYEAAFDAVGAFDVIEHITEDERVLASVHRALKPGGVLIVTVPQHKWLWSWTDEQARHKRRYGRRELIDKIRAAGFQILHTTSFVTALLPVLYMSRFAVKHERSTPSEIDLSEFEISHTANAVCGAMMRIDEALIRAGLSLPLGCSLLAVARKVG